MYKSGTLHEVILKDCLKEIHPGVTGVSLEDYLMSDGLVEIHEYEAIDSSIQAVVRSIGHSLSKIGYKVDFPEIVFSSTFPMFKIFFLSLKLMRDKRLNEDKKLEIASSAVESAILAGGSVGKAVGYLVTGKLLSDLCISPRETHILASA